METKHLIVIVFIAVAAIIAAGLSIFQYWDSVQTDKENSLLQEDLIQTQDKLIKSQDETIKMVLGFGKLLVVPNWVNDESIRLVIQNNSEYPIYDIAISIYNQDLLDNCPKIKTGNYPEPVIRHSCLKSCGIELETINLTRRKHITLNKMLKLESENLALYSVISTRHATFIQYSIVDNQPENDEFYHYYRLFEVINGDYNLIETDAYNNKDKVFNDKFDHFGGEILYIQD